MVAVAAGFAGVTGCSTAGEETGTTVEDVQEADDGAGADGSATADAGSGAGAGGLLGQTVTVSANVGEVISPKAFTIAGGDVEELLIVGANQPNNLQPGGLVEVTGTVRQFAIAEAEEFVGTDLDDGLFTEFEQEPYIQAQTVEVQ